MVAPPIARVGASWPTPERTPAVFGAPSPQPGRENQFSIPNGYGDNRIVLMVKDPWWLFAYWEINPHTEREARSRLLPQEVVGLQSILRVHDVTGLPTAPAGQAGVDFPPQPPNRSFDISLSGLATNWYIQTNAPNGSFIVEIGLLTQSGRFLLLARSNRVTTPRFGPSDIIDEAWMTSDEAYWKLFGAATGLGGSSPSGWARLIPQQLFSGSWASPSLAGRDKPAAVRGFWCRVDTDLVIHGATDPRATVVIQGQRVALRKDGTFNLRLALPEGSQTITIEVTSHDGSHTRTVTPIVSLAWAGALGAETTQREAQLRQSMSAARDTPTRSV